MVMVRRDVWVGAVIGSIGRGHSVVHVGIMMAIVSMMVSIAHLLIISVAIIVVMPWRAAVSAISCCVCAWI